jgi:MFS family permease
MHSTYEALDRPGGFDSSGILSPLRERDFRLLWTGMTVSLLGDGVFLVAIAWQAYELSNVPTALSLVGLAMSLPHIALLLVGGVVSDRVPRRRCMLWADVLRGLAIGVIALLGARGTLEVFHLAVLAAVYGAGTAFFGPAFDAIVPDIVPKHLLAQANSLDYLVRPLALRMVGPALGGWIIGAWGSSTAFALDAATFAVSAAALLMMNVSVVHGPLGGAATIVSELTSGFRFVRAHVWLWGTFLAATFAYLLFMGPAEVLLPYLVKNDALIAGDAGVLGVVYAIGGVGAIGTALVMGRTGLPRRNITFMFVTWTAATAAVALYGIARASWHLMAASLLFHGFETAGTIVWLTTKQRLVPPALLGRVSSLDWLISIGLLPLSYALTGPVAAAFGARATLVTAGTVGALVTLAALFLPGMRAADGLGHRVADPGIGTLKRPPAPPPPAARVAPPPPRVTSPAPRTRPEHPPVSPPPRPRPPATVAGAGSQRG